MICVNVTGHVEQIILLLLTKYQLRRCIHLVFKGKVGRWSPLLTVGDRLGPARVRGRVIVHQIQVDSSHHAVQLGYLLAVGGEELVCDRLSSNQIVTDEEKRMIVYLQDCRD